MNRATLRRIHHPRPPLQMEQTRRLRHLCPPFPVRPEEGKDTMVIIAVVAIAGDGVSLGERDGNRDESPEK